MFLSLFLSLIKHLESLVVNYDYTVRDTDGSVIQFNYGEDSIDVCKSSYLDRFSFLTTNYKALVHKLNPASGLNKLDIHTADAYLNGELTQQPAAPAAGSKKKGKHAAAAAPAKPEVLDPVLSLYNPGRFLGSLSEKYAESMDEYIARDPDGMVRGACIACTHPTQHLLLSYLFLLPSSLSRVSFLGSDGVHRTVQTPKFGRGRFLFNSLSPFSFAPRASWSARAVWECFISMFSVLVVCSQLVFLQFAHSNGAMTHDKFKALMKLHYIACLVNPGESVGILAGQSIGEPSTQMTLNVSKHTCSSKGSATIALHQLVRPMP